MHEAFYYHDYSKREAAGFKKKSVLEDINNHHGYDDIREIIKRHFEIA
jgi:hypothetical protein